MGIRPINAMKSSRLCMTWTTLYHGLKPLDTRINSRLCMAWMIVNLELKALDAMNIPMLWMI